MTFPAGAIHADERPQVGRWLWSLVSILAALLFVLALANWRLRGPPPASEPTPGHYVTTPPPILPPLSSVVRVEARLNQSREWVVMPDDFAKDLFGLFGTARERRVFVPDKPVVPG